MSAKEEIEKLKSEFITLNTEEEISEFRKKIKSGFEDKTEAEKEEFCQAFTESALEAIDRADKVYNYVNVKMNLKGILDIVSMSYIAENYFHKSRAWFSQRLNGHIVNGAPVSFTSDELKILSSALDDISKKLQDASRAIA